MTIKNWLGAVGALALSLGAVLAAATPAQAVDGHYPDAGWQVRDIAIGDTEWSPAAASTIVDDSTVELTKPAGTTGTSIETDDLGLPVAAGDAIAVSYALEDGADIAAGAIRLFYYDTASADTLLVAPTAFAIADGTGTLVVVVAADVTVGTLGLTYDASNAATGTVRFTNLVVGDTPVLFEERPAPEPTEPAGEPEPSTDPTDEPAPGAGDSAEQLPATGPGWLPVLAVGGSAAIVLGALALLLGRRRRTTFTAGEQGSR